MPAAAFAPPEEAQTVAAPRAAHVYLNLLNPGQDAAFVCR
jgi:hypothetical protein